MGYPVHVRGILNAFPKALWGYWMDTNSIYTQLKRGGLSTLPHDVTATSNGNSSSETTQQDSSSTKTAEQENNIERKLLLLLSMFALCLNFFSIIL
jgi:hypothetical protein